MDSLIVPFLQLRKPRWTIPPACKQELHYLHLKLLLLLKKNYYFLYHTWYEMIKNNENILNILDQQSSPGLVLIKTAKKANQPNNQTPLCWLLSLPLNNLFNNTANLPYNTTFILFNDSPYNVKIHNNFEMINVRIIEECDYNNSQILFLQHTSPCCMSVRINKSNNNNNKTNLSLRFSMTYK